MICNGCGVDKTEEHFYNRHGHVCKPCFRARRYKQRKDNPKLRMLASARARAKADKTPFDLIPEDFEIPDFCPVLGIKLVCGIGVGGFKETSPSLDKIIPCLGYIRGNVAVISNRANRLKNDATSDEISKVLDWVVLATAQAKSLVGSFEGRSPDKPRYAWITKDTDEIRVRLDHLDKYLPEGWVRGRLTRVA